MNNIIIDRQENDLPEVTKKCNHTREQRVAAIGELAKAQNFFLRGLRNDTVALRNMENALVDTGVRNVLLGEEKSNEEKAKLMDTVNHLRGRIQVLQEVVLFTQDRMEWLNDIDITEQEELAYNKLINQ